MITSAPAARASDLVGQIGLFASTSTENTGVIPICLSSASAVFALDVP